MLDMFCVFISIMDLTQNLVVSEIVGIFSLELFEIVRSNCVTTLGYRIKEEKKSSAAFPLIL